MGASSFANVVWGIELQDLVPAEDAKIIWAAAEQMVAVNEGILEETEDLELADEIQSGYGLRDADKAQLLEMIRAKSTIPIPAGAHIFLPWEDEDRGYDENANDPAELFAVGFGLFDVSLILEAHAKGEIHADFIAKAETLSWVTGSG